MPNLAAITLAYLLGCLQTGYYLARFRHGLDLRRYGSGQTGARNAGRLLGPSGFLLTLAGDAAKAALAVALARGLHAAPWAVAATLPAVAAGHIWPVQLRFSGGRGAAAGLGGIAALEPGLLLPLAAAALVIVLVSRRFTAAAATAFVAPPAAAWWLARPAETIAALALLAAFILYAHRTHFMPGRTPGPAPVRPTDA